jgi:hypothetical protein
MGVLIINRLNKNNKNYLVDWRKINLANKIKLTNKNGKKVFNKTNKNTQ